MSPKGHYTRSKKTRAMLSANEPPLGDSINEYRQRPKLVTGADGLPHCGRCISETELCSWHRAQVRHLLDNLKSVHLLAKAQTDLRFIIHHKDKYAEPDAT